MAAKIIETDQAVREFRFIPTKLEGLPKREPFVLAVEATSMDIP